MLLATEGPEGQLPWAVGAQVVTSELCRAIDSFCYFGKDPEQGALTATQGNHLELKRRSSLLSFGGLNTHTHTCMYTHVHTNAHAPIDTHAHTVVSFDLAVVCFWGCR